MSKSEFALVGRKGIDRPIAAGVVASLLALTACSEAADTARLKKENAELRGQLVERDRQIATLQQRAAQVMAKDTAAIGAGTAGMEATTDDDPSALTPLQLPNQPPSAGAP